LDWLAGPAILLAIPVIFLIAVLLVTFVLIFSLYTAFKMWRALNRLKKASKKEGEVIEGEYWMRD
jgi:membrane protein implicated in regulation of membrane protease activity